jgi:hypothetical protein
MVWPAIECGTALLTVALLTAFFALWLLPRVRPRPEWGRLLLLARRGGWQRKLGWLWSVFFLTGALALAAASTIGSVWGIDYHLFPRGPDSRIWLFIIQGILAVTPVWMIVILAVYFCFFAAVSLATQIHGIEIREHGIVQANGRWFLPWTKVSYCEWKSPGGRFFIRVKQPWRWLPPFTIRVAVRRDQIGCATQALLCHVELRERDGRPITPPAESRVPLVPLDEPPAAHNRFQFDLKMILLLFLVVASASSWIAVRRQRMYPVEQALSALAPFQLNIGDPAPYYPFMADFSKSPRQPTDDELAALEVLRSLNYVNLSGAPITDAGLAHLHGLYRLDLLNLSNTQITDAGLVYLREMKRLELLDLSGTRITGIGLGQLSCLSTLNYLGLRNTGMNDAGMANVERLQGIKSLSLGSTRVTDAGMIHLAALRCLETVSLPGTAVSDAGLVHLANLPCLKEISLYGAPVTDAGMASLARLPNLQWLHLGNTRVTDAAIEHLQKLHALQHIYLAGTKFTSNGRKRLQAALPGLEIN